MPQIRIVMEGYRDPLYDLDIKATMFFTKKVDFHFYHEAGKQFLCKISSKTCFSNILGVRCCTALQSYSWKQSLNAQVIARRLC